MALVLVLVMLLFTPAAASAGGWWSSVHLDRSTVAPGQRVAVAERVAFKSADDARRPFHVYLLRGYDDSALERAMRRRFPGDWWSLGGAEAIDVGDVTVKASKSNLARVRAVFTVPDLPAGSYHVMLCDAGCAEPMADVIPAAGFTVVADPATAHVAQRVDRLTQRVRRHGPELRAARARAARATVAVRAVRTDVERLERRVATLAAQREGAPLAWWAAVPWLFGGAALVLLLLRRRKTAGPTARACP